MFSKPAQTPESVPLQAQLSQMHVQDWLQNDVFHPKWWALIALLILSAAVWCLLLDKKRAKEVCLFAALCAVFALGLFEYGDELTLWDYPVDVIPFFPPLTSVNLILLPMVFSLLYQRFFSWKGYVIAVLAASAVVSFAVEPLLSLAEMYQLVNWNHILSFLVYTAVALLTRALTKKVLAITDRFGRQPKEYS